MARRISLRNPKTLTFILVVVTFLMAAAAVIIALTLQKKGNVNPTVPKAACATPSCDAYNTNKANYDFWKTQNPGKTDPTWEAQIATMLANCQTEQRNCNTGGSNPTPTGTSGIKCGNQYPRQDRCGAGQTQQCQVYCTSCPAVVGKDTCVESCTPCGINPTNPPAPTNPPIPTPTKADTTGWKFPNAACRYRTGGGTCAVSEFQNCNPAPGQMCVCRGNDQQGGDGWTYANSTTEAVGQCGSSCAGKNGGLYVATQCKNPYTCPYTTTPTAPSAPPTQTPPPVGTIIPNPTSTVTPPPSGGGNTPPPTTTSTPVSIAPKCVNLTFADGSKSKQMSPGEVLSLSATVSNPSSTYGKLIPFNQTNGQTAKLPITNSTGLSTMEVDYPNGSQNAVRFVNLTGNSGVYTWKISYDQLRQPDANYGGQIPSNVQLNAYAGGMTTGDSNCVVSLGLNTPPVTTQPPTPTQTVVPQSSARCENLALSVGPYSAGDKPTISVKTSGTNNASYSYTVSMKGDTNTGNYSYSSSKSNTNVNSTVTDTFTPTAGITQSDVSKPANYNVTVSSTSGSQDTTTLSNTSVCTANFTMPAQGYSVIKQALTLDGSATVSSVKPGDTFKYVITAANTGSTPVSNATIIDTFDPAFTNKFTLSNIDNNGTLSGNTVTWSGINIPGNGSVALTFQAMVKPEFFNGRTVCADTVKNTVNSSSPITTTPYSIEIYVRNDQCRVPSVLPTTGISDKSFIKNVSIALITIALITLFVSKYTQGRKLKFISDPRKNEVSFEETLKRIIEKLKR